MTKKAKISIAIVISIILIFIIILTITKTPKETLESDSSNQSSNLIKESPYTLEEIYEIVENPTKFKELNSTNPNDLAYVLCNFYNFFTKTTPFKIASQVKLDENGKVIEVLEVSYLSYAEYLERNQNYLDTYNIKKELCNKEENDTEIDYCHDSRYGITNIMYSYFATQLVYNNLIA